MVKKIALWAGYILIVGLLVFGAANRTSAKTDQGILFGNVEGILTGRGQAAGGTGNYESSDHEDPLVREDWVSFSGQVISYGAESLEIQTGSAGILEIEGRSWRFAQELGYIPVKGNEVLVQGFFENGDFEVSVIQDLTNDQLYRLRDDYGKPMWGGGGRN